MKKGSKDIPTLAVRNVLAGKYSIAQVAEMNGYSIATIYNWISIRYFIYSMWFINSYFWLDSWNNRNSIECTKF